MHGSCAQAIFPRLSSMTCLRSPSTLEAHTPRTQVFTPLPGQINDQARLTQDHTPKTPEQERGTGPNSHRCAPGKSPRQEGQISPSLPSSRSQCCRSQRPVASAPSTPGWTWASQSGEAPFSAREPGEAALCGPELGQVGPGSSRAKRKCGAPAPKWSEPYTRTGPL